MSSSFVAYACGEPWGEDVPSGIYEGLVHCNAEFTGVGQDWSRKTFLVTQSSLDKEG